MKYSDMDGKKISVTLMLYISIPLILGVTAILSGGLTTLMSTSTNSKIGPQGIQGIQGIQGVCLLNDTMQLFVSGNISIEQSLIIEKNATIVFDDSSTISTTDDCLLINSSKSLCLDVLSIKTPKNVSIFDNITICFDPNCTSGIGPGNVSGSIIIYGNTSFSIILPFLIGKNGGYLDQLPGPNGGFYLSSNPNSTGGITIDSRGYGLHGNETFTDFISFINYIKAGGFRIYYPMNNSNYLFDISYNNISNNVIITAKSVSGFIIQNANSSISINSVTSINLTTQQINIIGDQLFASQNLTIYSTNLSFNINSNSNQIGFYNGSLVNASTGLIGWIRSNLTCPISIGPLLCVLDIHTNKLTIDTLLYFSKGATINSNGTLNITSPNVFISNLTTNTFNVIGFTVFPSGISTTIIISTGTSTNNFAGPISSPIIQATQQLSALASFSAAGTAVLSGPTFLNNNVTFNGNSVKCITPLFQAGVPNACIPDCIDFYNCSMLRSVGYYGRNFIHVARFAQNISNISETFVKFGNDINFVSSNTSYLSTFQSNSKNSTIKSLDFSEYISLDYINMFGMNRTTIATIKQVGSTIFSPASCLPLITITINATGTPTPVTLQPPYYNYSDSTCFNVYEEYYFSNTTVTSDGVIIGSALINRTCSGGSNVVCTPFFNIDTKIFPFIDLLKAGTITKTTNLSQDLKTALATMISDLVSLNLTMQSIVDLFFVNTSNIATNVDTYALLDYAYLVTNSTTGNASVLGSNYVNLGKTIDSPNLVSVNSNTGDIIIPGNILSPDGDAHPCCGSSSTGMLLKFKSATLTTPLNIVGTTGSSGIISMNFGTSSSVGLLNGFTASSSLFNATSNAIYHINANLLLFNPVNITNIGCLYEIRNALGVLQYYRPGSQFSSIASLVSDGVNSYLTCSDFFSYLTIGTTIQVKLMTQSILTNTITQDFSITIKNQSFIQIHSL